MARRVSREGSLTAAEEQEQIRLVDSPEPDMNHDHLKKSVQDSQDIRRVNINRPVLTQTVLSIGGPSRLSGVNPFEYLNKKKCTPLGCLYSLLPILYWLPRYKWKQDITYDLIAGFTVATFHIPQGMAYALLGNLPPIIGIYMAFFPVIIYALMGTSRHVSMGTFAVICLMTGKVAAERAAKYNPLPRNDSLCDEKTCTDDSDGLKVYNEVDIAVALSLCIGLMQIAMGILRLGALSLLLSAEVVSGFTTGAAVHVLTSQFKNIFGLGIKGRTGIFKIIMTYKDIMTNIMNANPTAVILSAITIIALVIYNEVIKPYVSTKINFPIPVELFTIIIGTLVSSYWNMNVNFNITIVEDIPTGLPSPAIPPVNILPELLVDSLIISVVAYAISISMSKLFAFKHSYTLDANQELIALGTSNMVGSFFSCAPISVSLSRSLVQDLVGGKTQLASLVNCVIILFVLLWIGPFFETLPNCVLSAIIVVALKGMFMQFLDLPKAWNVSVLNALIWVLTFLATIVLDIEYGLAVGIFLSVLILLWRSNKPYIEVLGHFADTDLYVNTSHPQSRQIPGRKIIKYIGSLNFATIEHFIRKIQKTAPCNKSSIAGGEMLDWIILDFCSLSSIDPEALKSLLIFHKRYDKEGIQVLYAGCPPTVLQVMHSCKFINQIGESHFFPSVHDAVTHCSSNST